jgi:hypothetical protein
VAVISLVSRALVLFVLLSAPTLAVAQSNRDQLGASLGLTPETKSLPLWTKPSDGAVQEMAHTVRGLKEAIMLVGDPKIATGTAFVISRKYRLLATNAHVADIMKDEGKMLAIRNGTAVVYEVDKAWYHPGVRRCKNRLFSVRSQNPADGDIDANSPDVAVLHLADGPELPEELPLATVEEEEECLGAPIGMLGYPGHDTEGWPRLGEKAQATLREGIVCRLTDFVGGVSGASGEMQKLQHSLASWYGFSGSPLFLPNGHVIGLHNSAHGVTLEKEDRHVELAYGVRVDCLWELLAYHHLDGQVAIALDKSKLLLARYDRPDPALEKYNQAAKLVGEADNLLFAKEYADGVDKCQAAIELCPGYSKAYLTRALIYTNYNVDRFPGGIVVGTPVNKEQLKFARFALDDAQTYMEMNPNSAEACLLFCMKTIDVDIIRQVYNLKRHEIVIGVTTRLIEDPSVPTVVKARAYTARAAVRTNVPENTEFRDEIYADYDSAIRLDPFNPALWRNRASYDIRGSQQEQKDSRRARQLDQANQWGAAAWFLAATNDDRARDGRKAWELAVRACAATKYRQPNHLGALAASYAECGDFDSAVEYAKKAVQFAEGDVKDRLSEQLKLYEDEHPYRETAD